MSNAGPTPPPPGTQRDGASTGSSVAQVLLGGVAAVLLLLAIPLGLFEVGMLTMASDSCGSDDSCNKAAGFAMLAFGGGGPILVLVVVGIMAIRRSMRERPSGWSVAAILWCGVLADVVCIIAGFIAASAIDPG